ncbi:MAG: hypothetical protein N2Z84_03845, partial [Atribacterota bacterium]|nr:hypothetical protein [Atribacterota bacterium]
LVVAGIQGTYESFPRGAKFPRPFPIRVAFSHLMLSSTTEKLELDIRKEMEVLRGESWKKS